MGVGVDHTGHDDIALGIDLHIRRTIVLTSYGYNVVTIDDHISTNDLPLLILGNDPPITDYLQHDMEEGVQVNK